MFNSGVPISTEIRAFDKVRKIEPPESRVVEAPSIIGNSTQNLFASIRLDTLGGILFRIDFDGVSGPLLGLLSGLLSGSIFDILPAILFEILSNVPLNIRLGIFDVLVDILIEIFPSILSSIRSNLFSVNLFDISLDIGGGNFSGIVLGVFLNILFGSFFGLFPRTLKSQFPCLIDNAHLRTPRLQHNRCVDNPRMEYT
ncbi:hypothetical protein TMatcc_004528 [Talaromyces marneffei ATCC 18224]